MCIRDRAYFLQGGMVKRAEQRGELSPMSVEELTLSLIHIYYGLLRIATKDRLHQRYRLQLGTGGEEMLRKLLELGAYSSTVSGAGPTLLAAVPAGDKVVYEGISHFVSQALSLIHI